MLPAYGRELLELRRSGKRPAQPVYVVDNWEVARVLREKDRFVLVAEDRSLSYDFEPVRGLDVIAVPTDLDFFRQLPSIKAARPRWARRTLVFQASGRMVVDLVADAMELEQLAATEAGTHGRSTASAWA